LNLNTINSLKDQGIMKVTVMLEELITQWLGYFKKEKELK